MESYLTRSDVFLLSSIIGIISTVSEIVCYVVIFHHVTHHNNNTAANILQPSAIKQRNRSNAISFLGLFITWCLQILYIIVIGIIINLFQVDWFREYTSILYLDLNFFIIPWIQVATSPPIKRFLIKTDNNSE